MIALKKISPEELKSKLEKLVRHERQCTTLIVEHIAEVDRRQAYLEWGFTSLYEYLTQGLQYSESAAYRRIQAARALRQIPEIKDELNRGNLNLTQISYAQTAFRQEEKATGERVSTSEKRQVFADLRNKTSAQTQKILDGHMSTPHYAPAKTRHRADDSVEMTIRIPKELMRKLDRVKELYSHIAPHGELIQILELMANDVIQKRDPTIERQKKTTTQSFAASEVKRAPRTDRPSAPNESARSNSAAPGAAMSTSLCASTSNSQTGTFPQTSGSSAGPLNSLSTAQAIPKAVRRAIFRRDGGCQHVKPDGSKCLSRFQLQIDHIHPRFAGGTNALENLRLLCRVHNHSRYRKGAGLSPSRESDR